MKEILLSRVFCVGLCAYLRSLSLSVDRSFREDTQKLREYCNQSVLPTLSEVTVRLQQLVGGDVLRAHLKNGAEQASSGVRSKGRWSSRVQWYLRKGVSFREDEIAHISVTLKQFQDALSTEKVVLPSVFGPLRMRLEALSSIVFECIPDRTSRRNIRSVEHLNQNAILKTVPIVSITGRQDWLQN
jgi:hypothetical protein